ncbi:hypothetical protein DERF_002453 [Dermatophagoides farinae]|uniref:Uncharacterized protein n=1 Tax=Dermatophagoides farinae TaxID=6954 RepID=A0A922ID44_DERFA|nr:hypothetical protein DERF_002453 [Dermatophagoides farinae]
MKNILLSYCCSDFEIKSEVVDILYDFIAGRGSVSGITTERNFRRARFNNNNCMNCVAKNCLRFSIRRICSNHTTISNCRCRCAKRHARCIKVDANILRILRLRLSSCSVTFNATDVAIKPLGFVSAKNIPYATRNIINKTR